jgi:hypothetical protein
MLGAATLGALTTREARADDADSNPIAHQLRGRRVGVWSGEFYIEGKVEIVADSALYLSGVKLRGEPHNGNVVVHMAACQFVTLLDAAAT